MCHRLSPKVQAGEPPPRSGGRASEIEGSAGLALDGGGVGSLSHASVQPPGVPGPLRRIWVTWDACGSCWLWFSGGQGGVTPGLYPQATCTPYPDTLSAADIRSQLRAMSLLALRGLGVWGSGQGGCTDEVPFASRPLSPWEPLAGFPAKVRVPPTGSKCLRRCVLGSGDTWAPAGPASLGPRWTVFPPGSRPRCWPLGPVPTVP